MSNRIRNSFFALLLVLLLILTRADSIVQILFCKFPADLRKQAENREPAAEFTENSGHYRVYEVFNDVDCDRDLSNNTIGNNAITSVRVPPGWRVTLYDDLNCLGSKHVLQGRDDPFVSDGGGGFNDRASSIKVENPTTQESNGTVGDWAPD